MSCIGKSDMSERYTYCIYCHTNSFHPFQDHYYANILIQSIPTTGNWKRCNICFGVYKNKHAQRHSIRCQRPKKRNSESYNVRQKLFDFTFCGY